MNTSNNQLDRPLGAGQLLLLAQAKQIAELTEQCKALTALVAASGGGRGPRRPRPPAVERLRRGELETYAFEHYLPGRNHSPDSAVAEITRDLFTKINLCFPRRPLLAEVRDEWVERFRNWLASRRGDGFSAATANKYLRQLRAIANHAARKKLIRPLAPLDFLKQRPREVDPLAPEQLAALEAVARGLDGFLSAPAGAPVPLSVFWTAWLLVFEKFGSRVTATMLARRADYDSATQSILLRAETQKQRADQRIALPPRAAAAVERLLASHDSPSIFGCWPFDPPSRNGRRKWKTLANHFRRLLAEPAGVALPKYVVFHLFRHTAATLCEEAGGNPQELLGHSSPAITRIYTRKSKRNICRQSLCIPDADPQRALF